MSGKEIGANCRVGRREARGILLALMLAPLSCAAETAIAAPGANSASAHLSFRIVIPPVFRVLQITPVKEGYQYLVWTNMPSILLNGIEYRFNRVGETTLTIPAPPAGIFIVHGL
ncbi:hypothetical protein [Variovorax sp. YR216]|uniref:hypothetical protein n=1 Tax=Variovorax sp. YR216 TaxID=1882828 RepID=UPI000897F831|nr:hypothetical protein [Variovorax sp. YR216]SEA71522.1 hypothetical protein SAMN05444680_103238 [Variovorax sp. YR216]